MRTSSAYFAAFLVLGLGCSKPAPPAPAPAASASGGPAVDASTSMAAPGASASAGIPDAAVLTGSTATGPVTPKLTLDTSPMSPGEWHVTADGLPAISDDGKTVALFLSKEDGPRGYPNQGLLVKTVDGDKTDKELFVLTGDEINKAESAPNASATTLPALKKTAQARIDDGAALLSKSKWERMPWQTGAAADATKISVSGIEASLDGDRFKVKDSAGKIVVDEDAKGWKAKPHAQGKGMPECKFTPALGDVAADTAKRVVVVHVVQTAAGGDGCTEAGAYHAYRMK